MKTQHSLAALAALTIAAFGASAVVAQDEDTPEHVAVEMRQGHMLNQAHNLMVLGGMAQGKSDYDAAAAQTAADNLAHLAGIKWDYYWLPGTSSDDLEESHALPAIWENMDDFEAKHQALADAVATLQGAAGTDLASLQGAMQAVGQACGGCHETYREKDE